MDVFLIRHAEAIDETLELRDPMRHLTAHGREQAVALGDRLRWHDCTPTHIWTSPLVRAVQTAELVAAGLASKISVEVVPALAPDGELRSVVAMVKALAADANVVLVGHEPGLSGIGALLVGAPDFAALGKAEAARIHDGAVRWRCAWNAEAPTR
ncbi:MAG TPA: phosphohistidine phosphatase SixA [Kofleriaceae bacterium]|nr:phosphohistidine phosphatase SixA [Kofleriaceae bacterium]